jgi:hypothetical protein
LFVSAAGSSGRVTAKTVQELVDQLGERDEKIFRDLWRVRLLSGNQLDRLHFADLTPPQRARSRVLARLVRYQAVTTLTGRRVGGVRAGSAGLIYTLDAAGQRALRLLDHGQDDGPARRPWTPGQMFVAHTLAVSELYVRLREAERKQELELLDFRAEPACWQPTTTLGTLKPDAFVLVAWGDVEDAWWVEVDQATESRTTLRRKLELYLLAAQAGQVGPSGVLPRVLITVPDTARRQRMREVVSGLATPADKLFAVTVHAEAVRSIAEVLRE